MGEMPGWLMGAMPLLLVLGVMRALYASAQRQGKSAGLAAGIAIFVGSWISALGLWSRNYILTLPGHDPLSVSRYGGYLLADLAVMALIWGGITWAIIRIARKRALAAK